MNTLTILGSSMVGTFVLALIFIGLGWLFQLWRVLREREQCVYTLFGKVIGSINEPGLYSPLLKFGPKALLVPFFGQVYQVNTWLNQSYLRNQLVNSEEGAPMGVGIWFEYYVSNPEAFFFQNSDPLGSLHANVATAVVKQLSNLKLEVLLENRDALSAKVRDEVCPTSSKWGFKLGSTYIRKVAFRDSGMIQEIERKVVNRLRQVTASMNQTGANKVAVIRSNADRLAAEQLGLAHAVRPEIIGSVLATVQKSSSVAKAMFELLDIEATLASPGKIIIGGSGNTQILLTQ